MIHRMVELLQSKESTQDTTEVTNSLTLLLNGDGKTKKSQVRSGCLMVCGCRPHINEFSSLLIIVINQIGLQTNEMCTAFLRNTVASTTDNICFMMLLSLVCVNATSLLPFSSFLCCCPSSEIQKSFGQRTCIKLRL